MMDEDRRFLEKYVWYLVGCFLGAGTIGLLMLLTPCLPHPGPNPHPTPTPTPDPAWVKMGKLAVGPRPLLFQRIKDKAFAVSDVWPSARTVPDLKRRAEGRRITRAEFFLPFDAYYRIGIENSTASMRAWLKEIRDWNWWDGKTACPYSLYDSILATAYTGVLLELNADTSGCWYVEGGKWHGNYHQGRHHPELRNDERYRKLVMQTLKVVINDWQAWQRSQGYPVTNPVVALTVENEPGCCESRVMEFTLAQYIQRLSVVHTAVKDIWPAIDIQAGGRGPEWSIPVWQSGKADIVSFHFIPPHEHGWTYPDYKRHWDGILAQFDKAGVPRSRILAGEVYTKEHMQVTAMWARVSRLRGISWTTFTTDVIDGVHCSPLWSINLDPLRRKEPVEAFRP